MASPIIADRAPLVEGFCRPCEQDVPLSADKRCAVHAWSPILPPTWGRRTWAWDREMGCWVPYTPRPEGYVFRMPKDTGFNPHAGPAPRECVACGAAFANRQRGVTGPRTCEACRAAGRKALAS